MNEKICCINKGKSMKKTVSVNWEEYKSIDSKDCWRLVAEFPEGNIRLGFIRQTYNDKYIPALDYCEGGMIKVNFLKSVDSLDEAKNRIYEALFLGSMAESNGIEEINFDWDTKVCPEYEGKTFTLVGKFPNRKIRFAHIRLNVCNEFVMFLSYCTRFPDAKCIGRVNDLETAKKTVIEKLYKD